MSNGSPANSLQQANGEPSQDPSAREQVASVGGSTRKRRQSGGSPVCRTLVSSGCGERGFKWNSSKRGASRVAVALGLVPNRVSSANGHSRLVTNWPKRSLITPNSRMMPAFAPRAYMQLAHVPVASGGVVVSVAIIGKRSGQHTTANVVGLHKGPGSRQAPRPNTHRVSGMTQTAEIYS